MWLKLFLSCGAVAGAAGVALGAWTAHAAVKRFEPAELATLDTVSRYLLVHGTLLVALAMWLRAAADSSMVKLAGALIVAGMVFFCGGLGVSVVTGLRGLTVVAPLGGMALIAGWLVLAVGVWFQA